MEERLDFRQGVFLGTGTRAPRICFLFPGQASPVRASAGAMGRRFELVRALYAEVQLPEIRSTSSTALAQPAIAAATLAGLRLLESFGVEAELGLGHSLGEICALHWAGALEADALLRVATIRGRVMAELGDAGGAMASIASDAPTVQKLLHDTDVEITAGRLDRTLAEGNPADQIPGLAWREHGELRVNPHGDYIDDLEALPFPAWDLIDIPRYRSFDRMSHSGVDDYMVVFTSRACPFKCTYCHEMFGKSFRKRSPENVLAELRELHDRYGIREFEIIDDIFNCDQQRAKQIFQMIIDSDMQLLLTFPNGIRADAIDEEFLRLARQAGVVFMAFAIETATPRLQKMLRKNIRLHKIEHNIALARQHGIFCLGFFMLGFPTETRQELQATLDFAIRSKLHAANFFVVNPFEGTDLAEQAKDMGKPVFGKFDDNYLSPGFTNLTDLPDAELQRIRRIGIVRFWLRPSRLWAALRDYPLKRRLPHMGVLMIKKLLLRA